MPVRELEPAAITLITGIGGLASVDQEYILQIFTARQSQKHVLMVSLEKNSVV